MDAPRFLLRPCRLLSDRFVPSAEESFELDWKGLVRRFSHGPYAAHTLQRLRTGAYLGMTSNPGSPQPVSFCLYNTDGSGKIKHVLRKDPSFAERLLEVYQVEEAHWGSRTTEPA
jgi:hypothetical protein